MTIKKASLMLIILILFLTGCESNYFYENNYSYECNCSSEWKNDDIQDNVYREGIWYNKDWAAIEFPVEEDCVPDKETAVAVSRIYLERFQQQGYFIDYTLLEVFYDTVDRIWIITFSESKFSEGTYYIGACFSIAIRRENAEVIKMWVGE